MNVRHFLTLNDLSRAELLEIIKRAIEMKEALKQGKIEASRQGKILAMIFEKSSTRTRVSFETAIVQLGGHGIFMSPDDSQLGRGEPLEDTARVLSKMVDCVMIRTFEHEKLMTYSKHSEIPVINGLSDSYHPCQVLADMQTFFEIKGDVRGKTVAWLGDGNNMCHSYINAARILDLAVKDADLVVTDVWASMGQEQESEQRAKIFNTYQVNSEIMSLAANKAIFMHCLPAHRGEEVTAEVIDGPQSVVWEEAGNRLHSQKALLEFLL